MQRNKHIEGSGAAQKMETADLVSGYVQRLMFVSLLRQLKKKKKSRVIFFKKTETKM